MNHTPFHIREVLQVTELPVITDITRIIPEINYGRGSPEELMRLGKDQLVNIIRHELYIRNSNRLKKFSLVNIIWLGIRNTHVAESLAWLHNTQWTLRDYDALRYVFIWVYRNIYPNGPPNLTHNYYNISPDTDWRTINKNKLKYCFSIQFYYILLNCNNTSMGIVSRMIMEAFISIRMMNFSFSPSIISRNRRIPNINKNKVHDYIIPDHFIKEFIELYGKYQEDYKECPICLDNISSKDMKITRCGHFFHGSCLNQINKDECPTCRTKNIML